MDILHRRERQKANKERAREKARGYIAEYFATHSCTDCGESDPIILTFDHLPDRDKKRADISLMVRDGLGLEAIKAEIEKCEVVCFNCQSIRTQQRAGHYRWRMGKTGRT